MKRVLFALALSLAIVTPVAAEMISNVYPPINGQCNGSDHAIWSTDSGSVVITGCIPAADWNKSISESQSAAFSIGVTPLSRGQSVQTTHGYVDTCPTWFPMGCVIAKEIFVKFI